MLWRTYLSGGDLADESMDEEELGFEYSDVRD